VPSPIARRRRSRLSCRATGAQKSFRCRLRKRPNKTAALRPASDFLQSGRGGSVNPHFRQGQAGPLEETLPRDRGGPPCGLHLLTALMMSLQRPSIGQSEPPRPRDASPPGRAPRTTQRSANLAQTSPIGQRRRHYRGRVNVWRPEPAIGPRSVISLRCRPIRATRRHRNCWAK
jgi:hypothetical protein